MKQGELDYVAVLMLCLEAPLVESDKQKWDNKEFGTSKTGKTNLKSCGELTILYYYIEFCLQNKFTIYNFENSLFIKDIIRIYSTREF